MSLGFFVDVQGTLISDQDGSLLPGAKELIKALNKKEIPYCVITNNTKRRSDIFLKKLQDMGLEIAHYLDPFMVIKSVISQKRLAPFGPKCFEEILKDLGYEIDMQNPQALVITSYTDFDSKAYANMIKLAQKGVEVIGMHGTSIYSKNGFSYPGVGAILSMISYATSCKTKIIGKPSHAFYNEGLKIIQSQNSSLEFADIEIVSDDAKGDLVEAKKMGMKTRLVLSGKIPDKKSVEGLISYIDKIDSGVDVLAKELG